MHTALMPDQSSMLQDLGFTLGVKILLDLSPYRRVPFIKSSWGFTLNAALGLTVRTHSAGKGCTAWSHLDLPVFNISRADTIHLGRTKKTPNIFLLFGESRDSRHHDLRERR